MLKRIAWHAAVAVGLLLVAASAAGAEWHGQLQPGGTISAVSNGRLTFGTSITIQCDVTLDGTLASDTLELAAGRQIGSVTAVRTANCAGGSVSAISDLPWPITVSAIAGTLPSAIESVLADIQGMDLTLSVFGGLVTCRYAGTGGAWIATAPTETSGLYDVEQIVVDEAVMLPRTGGSGLCPTEGAFAGSFSETPEHRLAAFGPEEMRMECREARNPAVAFETVNLGGISQRDLTCRNTSAVAILRIIAGSGIVGREIDMFRIIRTETETLEEGGLPSVGTLIDPGGNVRIRLRFAPDESDEVRGRTYARDFKLRTFDKELFITIHGSTNP